jgi:homoserine O-acetyltransferase
MSDYERFELGDLPLQSGEVLRDAVLAYKTYGSLDPARTNVVIFPTAYGGTHADNEWLIGPGKALDTTRYFVVAPNLFGGGLSSSPSTTLGAQAGPAFPHTTIYDNVEAHHKLVIEALGARRIALVVGFSMGAQQAFHWGARAPELVERIAPFCGSARTAEHNVVFLDGIAATLTADAAFAGGHYVRPPLVGLRAVGRVWAAWGLSQTFYREERWRELGYASREAFVSESYVDSFASADANDLLAMLWTWKNADVGAHVRFEGNWKRALAAIRARALVMPSASDLYFPPEDNAREVGAMPNAELAVIPSDFGHAAGGNLNAADSEWLAERIAALLNAPGA